MDTLSWFHVSAIVSNAAINMGMQMPLRESNLLQIYTQKRNAVDYGSPIFKFSEKPSYCFLQWLCQVTCKFTDTLLSFHSKVYHKPQKFSQTWVIHKWFCLPLCGMQFSEGGLFTL